MRATRRVILLSPPLAILLAFALLLPFGAPQAQSASATSGARLADLMLPEARTFSSRQREGEWRYSSRTREEERAGKFDGRMTERGFAPTLLVSGPLAVVWMPYDRYIDGAWSHCGVDAFTMYKVAGRWQIATLAWSVEQPPACAKHPAGAPQP